MSNITAKGFTLWIKQAEVGASIVFPRNNADSISAGKIPAQSFRTIAKRFNINIRTDDVAVINTETMQTQRGIQITVER